MKTLEQCYQEVYKKWSTGTEWMPSTDELKRMDNEAAQLYAEEQDYNEYQARQDMGGV